MLSPLRDLATPHIMKYLLPIGMVSSILFTNKIIQNQESLLNLSIDQSINLLDYAIPLSVVITPIIALMACSDKLRSKLWFRFIILVILIFPCIYILILILSHTFDPAFNGSIIDYFKDNHNSWQAGDGEQADNQKSLQAGNGEQAGEREDEPIIVIPQPQEAPQDAPQDFKMPLKMPGFSNTSSGQA